MNSFKFILILLNVVASAWNIAIEAWAFAALSGGLARSIEKTTQQPVQGD